LHNMKMADRSTRIHGTSTIHSLPKNYTESIAYCVRVQKKKRLGSSIRYFSGSPKSSFPFSLSWGCLLFLSHSRRQVRSGSTYLGPGLFDIQYKHQSKWHHVIRTELGFSDGIEIAIHTKKSSLSKSRKQCLNYQYATELLDLLHTHACAVHKS